MDARRLLLHPPAPPHRRTPLPALHRPLRRARLAQHPGELTVPEQRPTITITRRRFLLIIICTIISLICQLIVLAGRLT